MAIPGFAPEPRGSGILPYPLPVPHTVSYQDSGLGANAGVLSRGGALAVVDPGGVRLIQNDAYGVVIVDWMSAEMTDPPTAAFDLAATGLQITLTDRSSAVAPSTITAWSWRLLDGTGTLVRTSQVRSPILFAPAAGTYTVELTVTDSQAQSATASQIVTLGVGSTAPPYPLPTDRYAGWVLVEQESGGFVDLTRIPVPGGYEDRVLGYRVNEHFDASTRTATVTVGMSAATGSLSPTAATSPLNNLSGTYSPLIYGGRRLIIQEPLGALNSTNPDDWYPVFWGYLDSPDAPASGEMTLPARDALSRMQIPTTGEPVVVGSAGATTLREAVQIVLDSVFGAGFWVVFEPIDLEFGIEPYRLDPGTQVLDHIRGLAQQRGANIRWIFDPVTKRPQLTLYVVDRNGTVPVRTFAAAQTIDISRHAVDVTTVRNLIDGAYFAPGTTEPSRLVVSDGPSKRNFGLQPIRIQEASTSQIDTAAEMHAYLLTILNDVRDPGIDGARRVPYTYDLQIGNLVGFGGDGRVSDDALTTFGVAGWDLTHEARGSDTQRYTDVLIRARPAGQHATWLRSGEVGGGGVPGGSTGAAPTATPLPPTFVTQIGGSTAIQTVLVRFVERGIPVQAMEKNVKPVGGTWSGWVAAERRAGQGSVVVGGSLQLGEYEADAALVGNGITVMQLRVLLQDGTRMAVGTFPLDADAFPTILNVKVEGKTILTLGDTDTLSWRFEHVGGTWVSDSDGQNANVAVPVPDGVSWSVRITAYNAATASRDAGTLTAIWPADVLVAGTGIVTNTRWVFVSVAPPEVNENEAPISLRASGAAAGEVVSLFSRYASGQAWSAITDLVWPKVTTPPTTTVVTRLSTQYRNAAGEPDRFSVTLQILAEIRSGSGVLVDSATAITSWETNNALTPPPG